MFLRYSFCTSKSMSGSNTPNLFGKSEGQGDISVAKIYKSYPARFLKTNSEFPLLPNVMVDYKFNRASYPIEIKGKKTDLKFPKVNEILTEYCGKSLQTYCTVEFIELINQQPFAPNLFPFKDERLEYAVSLYNTIYNLPATLDSARNTLSYYLGDSFDFLGSNSDTATKLSNLRNSLKSVEAAYLEKLLREVPPNTVYYTDGKPLDAATVNWFNSQKQGKVLNQEAAEWFIKRANEEMKLDVDVEFAKARIKTVMFNADPIISDPRFRMSLADTRWNEYDETIKKEVAFYNQKFAGVANFVPLDWRYVKAMVWTEVMAGPNEKKGQWQQKPMQIGVTGDPGLGVVTNEKDDADLIVSPELRNEIRNNHFGHNNIKAGIANLYYKAIEGINTADPRKVASRDVVDNSQILATTVQKNENGFEVIAKRLGITTTGNIKINNPGLDSKTLQLGKEIKYQKAHTERYITGWRDWMTTIKSYNSRTPEAKGDTNYMDKVNRAYQIIISRQK
jgi:hypothetical protein